MSLVAMLALVGAVVGQEQVSEQRIAELIERLGDPKMQAMAASELTRHGKPAVRRMGRFLLQAANEPKAGFLPTLQVVERMGLDGQVATARNPGRFRLHAQNV